MCPLQIHFGKIWGNPGLFLFTSVLLQFQFQQYKLKKGRWFAWELNPQLQDGIRRQNHGAKVAIVLQCLHRIVLQQIHRSLKLKQNVFE